MYVWFALEFPPCILIEVFDHLITVVRHVMAHRSLLSFREMSSWTKVFLESIVLYLPSLSACLVRSVHRTIR
jgi:hypothetical protein